MRRFLLTLPALVSLFLVLGAAAGYKHWKLVEDDEGIRVWTLEIPGRDVPGFRAITQIKATIPEIVAVMVDVKNHHKWMWQCDGSRTVHHFSDSHEIVYNRVNSPWPVRDRDVVVDVAYRYTPDNQALTFRFKNVEDPGAPPVKRVVRLPRLEGFYRLWTEEPGKTNVLYQVELDVGGNIPDFLARIYGRKVPYKTLERLRERVEDSLKGEVD